jgi:hypothetical protein
MKSRYKPRPKRPQFGHLPPIEHGEQEEAAAERKHFLAEALRAKVKKRPEPKDKE